MRRRVPSSGNTRVDRDTLVDPPSAPLPSSPSGGSLDLPRPSDPRVGTMVADTFRLLEVRGTGRMGTTFEARNESTGELVAVKLLHSSYRRSKPHESRFMWEARVGATIQHPNCMRVFSAGRDLDETLYQVLELLQGETLGDLVTRGPLLAPDVLKVGREMLAGLDAVHVCGLVHRSVRPSNIFLNCSPGNVRTKLLDFGIARKQRASDELPWVMLDGAMESPAYLSPEQCAAASRATVRSDIWSAGAVLFHALAGQPPFADARLYTLLKRIAEEPAPSLREVRPDLPESLIGVVDRALMRHPVKRWNTAREMAMALAEVTVPVDVR